jgi:Zn-dependent protease with chaperone function
MDAEQFQALVRRLEAYARKKPAQYRLRVGLLAALGYAYLLAVVALLVAVLTGLVWVFINVRSTHYLLGKFGWIVLVFLVILMRALWVRLSPPEGIELRRQDAPRLFEEIASLARSLRAPRCHRVLVTGDLNAALAQVPRLGLFGWQQNFLLLGLPLMQVLSPDQFRAVVAHELGHLSGNHGRFDGWIYRVRRTWGNLLERLAQEQHAGSAIVMPFFNWYGPFFSAYSFVLARADEYVADACARELAGAPAAAATLLRLSVAAPFMAGPFWLEVYRRADRESEPPADGFTSLLAALPAQFAGEAATTALDHALAQETGYSDTHPCLTERLRALGYDPASARAELNVLAREPLAESAAERFLGAATTSLAARFDREWQEAAAPRWRARHAFVRETRQRLAALVEKAREQPLSEEETWDHARCTGEIEGDNAAVPLLRALLDDHPEHSKANFAYGQLLLKQGDDSGIAHVERAMAIDLQFGMPGVILVSHFLRERGRIEEAARFEARAPAFLEKLAAHQQQRSTVTDRDTLLPHDLPAAEIERLRAVIARHDGVRVAYLVRKASEQFPDRPLFVLGVKVKTAWYKYEPEGRQGEIAQQLANELDLPGDWMVVLLNRKHAGVRKVMGKCPGALIFNR